MNRFFGDLLGVADENSSKMRKTERYLANYYDKNTQEILSNLVEKRKIFELLHFTTTQNLVNILDEEAIFSRDTCEKLRNRGVKIDFPDEQRMDGRTDCTSVSISWVNYKMLHTKRAEQPFNDWVVLKLSSKALILLEALYCPTNAAHKKMRTHIGKYDIEHMFVDPIVTEQGKETTRSEIGIADCQTSDPQAEVLIRSTIDIDLVKKFIFPETMSSETRLLYNRLKIDKNWRAKVTTDDKTFDARNDFHFWKGDSLVIPLKGMD